ncbi:MAG: CBS domain-containing protein [Rhodoluna sp.]|nr:CBS domain-containing protein [Rhodoluna sp.]
MIALAIWIGALLAIVTTLTAIVKAALEVDESAKAESLSFVRLGLTGVFGIVAGQIWSPLQLSWYWPALFSTLMMAILLFGSQYAAKKLGHAKFGQKLLSIFSKTVDSIHLLFTPISLPKVEEPEEFEQELLDSVEEFGETIVREIMVPRIDMATVPADYSLSKSMSVFLSRGYSRLPVVGKNIDDISGILYLKDVARILHESPKKMDATLASEIARPVIFIPESKPVDDLLREMQLSSTHIAVIVDEYGGVAGLATMEDVIEEIVGEISDEYDKDLPDVDDLGDGRFRVNASYSLAELGELLELELEDEDVDSVGGLFAKELGRLPGRGDEVSVSGLVITADRIEGRRKRLITVVLKKDENLADAQSAFEQLEQEK